MTSRLTRRITSTQPHLSTPIITLSPPTVMNSLPISLYSHTLCSGTSLPPRPLILGFLGAEQAPKYCHVIAPSTLEASSCDTLRVTPLRLRPSIPGVARHHSLKPLGYEFLIPILQSSETAPGSRMALQPHPRSPVQQSRARGSPLTLAGHQPLGPDADPSANEGRGTPHETTEDPALLNSVRESCFV